MQACFKKRVPWSNSRRTSLPAGVGENPYAGSGKTQYLKLSNPLIRLMSANPSQSAVARKQYVTQFAERR